MLSRPEVVAMVLTSPRRADVHGAPRRAPGTGGFGDVDVHTNSISAGGLPHNVVEYTLRGSSRPSQGAGTWGKRGRVHAAGGRERLALSRNQAPDRPVDGPGSGGLSHFISGTVPFS